jgi:hypothetical protein
MRALWTQNLVIALGVIVLLVTADVLGRISLPAGVIGHEGSTLLVTLSGLRLLQRIRLDHRSQMGSRSKKGAGRTRERNLSLSKMEERPCPIGSLS